MNANSMCARSLGPPLDGRCSTAGGPRRRRWPRTAARRRRWRHCRSCRQSSRIAKSVCGAGVAPGLHLLEDERRRVDAEARGAELQPEAHDLLDLLAHRGVGPVQVGLEVVEAVEVPRRRPSRPRSRSRSARRGRRCPAGGRAAPSSLQTYQSRYGDCGELRADRNHGCWSEVWLTTRSSRMRMPRWSACRVSSTKSPRVPSRGSTRVVVGRRRSRRHGWAWGGSG